MSNRTNFDENALMCSGVSTYLPESTTEAEFGSHTSTVFDRLALDYDNISYSLKGGKKISTLGVERYEIFSKKFHLHYVCYQLVCNRILLSNPISQFMESIAMQSTGVLFFLFG